MEELAPYTFVHEKYFEPLSRYPVENGGYRERIAGLLPDEWSVQRDTLWFFAQPPSGEIPAQGFKIHVSATPLNAETVLDRSVPVLSRYGCTFKTVIAEPILRFMNSKNFDRGKSNKFITAYPRPDDFKPLCQDLHEATSDLDSPYILSDRPYEEGGVVFYRYGGFKPRKRLDADGTTTPLIQAPDGTEVVDRRTPYYQLPEWVEDPFGRTEETEDGDGILNDRYEIEGALKFSNSGGVYRATDVETGDTVVLKEARPLTNVWDEEETVIDAVDILRNEYHALTLLADVDGVPNARDFFQAWDHWFLVQDHVKGIPLNKYRAQNEISLAPFKPSDADAAGFCAWFRDTAEALIDLLESVHEAGVVIADFAPSNVIVQNGTSAGATFRLLDLESAQLHPDASLPASVEEDVMRSDAMKKFASLWATPGFRRSNKAEDVGAKPQDDLHALARILSSLLLPIQSVSELEPEAHERILDGIEASTGLSAQVRDVIDALAAGDVAAARHTLATWEEGPPSAQGVRAVSEADRSRFDERLSDEIDEVATFVGWTLTPDRTDRVAPPDVRCFRTNPVSLAYGSSGVALFLDAVDHPDTDRVVDWTLDRVRDETTLPLPPGLFVGASGVAVTLLQLGRDEAACEIMTQVFDSPLRFASPDVLVGAAGWGLAALRFHHQCQLDGALDHARAAADYLIESSRMCDAGRYWGTDDPLDAPLGMAHGTCGIGLFLLRFAEAAHDAQGLDAACDAVDFELAHAIEEGNALHIGRTPTASLREPYWKHGTSGLTSVLSRFAASSDAPDYAEAARRTARGASMRFSAGPWQFEGLSGIGEAMLDLHYATGNDAALAEAYEIADSILRYRIEETPEGHGYPGRHLMRLSNDFATGAAGIGLFFDRLLHASPRPFYDVAQPLRRASGQVGSPALAS